MGYHVLGWSGLGWVTTLGTYAVYAFFVLSGFALEHVYGDRLELASFARARVARLAPLWLLVVVATVALTPVFDPAAIALNLSGLFGFVRPGATAVPTGGWSIGIEIVCYATFALLAWRQLSTRALVALTFVALVGRSLYVAAIWPAGATLADVFVPYTEAPAFLVFFLAGMVGARLRVTGSRHWPFVAGVILVGAAVLATPIAEQRDLFTGPLGLGLTALVCVGVAVAGSGAAWRGRAATAAGILGDLSYGTYLLHPLVWIVLTAAGVPLLTVFLAPALALAVHRWFERPVGRWIRSGGQLVRPAVQVRVG